MTSQTNDLNPLTVSRMMSATNATQWCKPAAIFGLAPLILTIIVIPAALEGDLSSPSKYSRVSDARHLLGLPSAYVSSPTMTLERDGLTVLLVLLVGYTFACAYMQCCALANCIPQLEESGVLKWRTRPELDLLPAVLQRSVVKSIDPKMHTRMMFSVWVNRRMSYIRRTEPAMLIAAAVLAAAFQYVIYRERSLEVLAPYSLSATARTHWADLAYRSWWASYYHWTGALSFFLVATFGIFIVLLQNSVLLATVSTAAVIRSFASPEIDWLNVDGHYGWGAVEKVFKASYLSIAIRGITLSALVIGFGSRNTAVVFCIAAGWLIFVLIYHIVPHVAFFDYIDEAKSARILELVHEAKRCRQAGRKGIESMRFYATEIERTRNANVNPMHLPRWQMSTFLIAVLLPAILTVAQIVF